MALRPEWHDEAREMRKSGATIKQIVAALDKSHSAVRYALDEGGTYSRLRETIVKPRSENPPRKTPKLEPVTPWPQRVADATREFAAGLIDRAELMRRLRKPDQQETQVA